MVHLNTMSILLKCFLVAILTRFAECASCLDSELYRPCQCSTPGGAAQIICNLGPTIEDAAKIFRALNGKVNDPVYFIIFDNKSESIGEKIFSDVPVKIAYINMPKLKYLSNSSFIGQEDSMVVLRFTSSNLDQIPYQGQLKKLKTFQFYDNQAITIIRKSWFTGIQNGNVLERLHIYNTAIQSIEKYTFSELVALRVLDLSSNRLSAFDASIISTNQLLKYVTFRSNRFTKIPVGFIKLISQKAKLSFGKNNITDISAEALEVIIEKDFTIDIFDNSLKCDCKWLRFANASLTKEWNGIFRGECQGPDSTKKLYIQLLKIEDFSSCKQFIN